MQVCSSYFAAKADAGSAVGLARAREGSKGAAHILAGRDAAAVETPAP